MKHTHQIILTAVISLLLGWSACGYHIYSGMFDFTKQKSVASSNDLIRGIQEQGSKK
jgi:hypothetical protein